MLRRAILTVIVTIAVLPAFGAPKTEALDDFEGELTGWSGDVEVVADGAGHCLRWTPVGDASPLSTSLNFAGREVEMDEWDWFEFRYKVLADAIDWWGVKIIDHPLGDGLQATYQLKPEDVPVGEWATARITLHPPMFKWGDTPNTTAQTIIFRLGSLTGGEGAILLDDICVGREALAIEAAPTGPVNSEGVPQRSFEVSVTNRLDQPMTVTLRADSIDAPAQVQLPAPVGIEGATTQTLPITMLIPAAAARPDALTPMTAIIFATNNAGDQVSSPIQMSLPLPEAQHPCLMVAADDIPRLKERTEEFEWAKQAYANMQRSADKWLDKDIEFPDRGGQWYHWFTCSKCGGRLRSLSPTEHECKSCGEKYSGYPYDDVYIMGQHSGLARAVRDLGLMYAFTGEDRYADKAREILLGYAERYLDYPMHNIKGNEGRGACHVAAQPLSEAVWLISIVQGFDCIWHALSEDERQTIADDMLLPAAELVRGYARSIHNIPCWENAAYGLVGLTLGNPELAGQAINGQFGFRNQILEGVTDDGSWYEAAWGYHYYTLMALEPLATAAEHFGIDLHTDRYESMFVAPVRMMSPNGKLPAFNDSSRASAMSRGAMYENAGRHWQAPEIGVVLGTSTRANLQALLYGTDEVAGADERLASAIFPASGVAVLRTDPGGDFAAQVAGVPGNYVALDYGPHGSGHGHPDKLGFEFYARGQLVATDAGSISYGNPAHRGWYKQTLAHNTVAVDGQSQQRATGNLLANAFDDGASLVVVDAGEAYPGVRLVRAMALVDDRLLDVTVATSDEEHQYDWAYHSRGDLTMTAPTLTALDEAPGEGPYEWAEDWRAAEDGRAWAGTWQVTDELAVRAAQACAADAQVMTAVGRGNPASARDPFVMSRCVGRTAVWGTALAFGEDGAKPEVALVQGRAGDEPVALEQAFALEAVVGDSRDLLIYSEVGEISFGNVILTGRAALLCWRGGKLASALVAEGSRIEVEGRPFPDP